jgi:hypothetical protein
MQKLADLTAICLSVQVAGVALADRIAASLIKQIFYDVYHYFAFRTFLSGLHFGLAAVVLAASLPTCAAADDVCLRRRACVCFICAPAQKDFHLFSTFVPGAGIGRACGGCGSMQGAHSIQVENHHASYRTFGGRWREERRLPPASQLGSFDPTFSVSGMTQIQSCAHCMGRSRYSSQANVEPYRY